MAPEASMELIRRLAAQDAENECLEFKVGNPDAELIAKDISALANSAAFLGQPHAYLIWGVEDATHELVGTSFNPYEAKGRGNQLLCPWLASRLANASYQFTVLDDEAGRFVALTIDAATKLPVTYGEAAFIREGNSTVRLYRGSEKEAELWRRLSRSSFEISLAMEDLALNDVRELLDIDSFFELMAIPMPASSSLVARILVEQDLLVAEDSGRFSITNLGALLLARNLRQFASLTKRAIRVVCYEGAGNLGIRENREFAHGYARSLAEAESFIMSVIPGREVAEGARRYVKHEFPQRAVRELLANTVIHQDLTDISMGPFVGIHSDRIEFSNPGKSLVKPAFVLNNPPKTRNAKLAGLLRQMNLCEESGTGWDFTLEVCEHDYLPAPRMRTSEETGTLVELFGTHPFAEMKRAERLDAIYWHACLRYAERMTMTNHSLRERFGLPDDESSRQAISRLIRMARVDGLIKPSEDSVGKKMASYVPHWA